MDKQNNQELNEQPQIEDLAINQNQAAEIKGGPAEVKESRASDYSAIVFVGGWGG